MSYTAIVDYGAGNLLSVSNAMKYIGAESRITKDKTEIEKAGAIILPGVGAFPDASDALSRAGLFGTIREEAVRKPFLGICLGMQLMFESGDEGRRSPGLSLFKGCIRRMQTPFKLPQIGWNGLRIINPSPITKGIEEGAHVYFVHSFAASDTQPGDVCAVTDYGTEVVAICARDNMFGCQFHPEKSGEVGIQMLKNFSQLMK